MRFALVAVGAGLLIGFAAGGRLRHVGDRAFRLWWLLEAGLALQVAGWVLSGGTGLAAFVASYGLLLAFAVANLIRVGMWLVALGIALNFLFIAVNGGMPVSPSALRAAGLADPGTAAGLGLEGKHHLERSSDRLLFLADVIPARPLRAVVSFGDVAMTVGVANVIVHLMQPAPARVRRPGLAAESA